MYNRTPPEFLVRLPRNTRFWVFCASKLYFSFSHFRLLFSTVCILRFLFCFSTLLPLNCFLVLLVYLFWYLIYLYIFQCAIWDVRCEILDVRLLTLHSSILIFLSLYNELQSFIFRDFHLLLLISRFSFGGLKWNRTIDLTLIRRAL